MCSPQLSRGALSISIHPLSQTPILVTLMHALHVLIECLVITLARRNALHALSKQLYSLEIFSGFRLSATTYTCLTSSHGRRIMGYRGTMSPAPLLSLRCMLIQLNRLPLLPFCINVRLKKGRYSDSKDAY